MEQRLIDANRMKEHVALQKDILVNMGMEEIGNTLTKMFFDEINIQPTVGAVPVVRCLERKKWNKYKDGIKGLCEHFDHVMPTREDFYCADGEKVNEYGQ